MRGCLLSLGDAVGWRDEKLGLCRCCRDAGWEYCSALLFSCCRMVSGRKGPYAAQYLEKTERGAWVRLLLLVCLALCKYYSSFPTKSTTANFKGFLGLLVIFILSYITFPSTSSPSKAIAQSNQEYGQFLSFSLLVSSSLESASHESTSLTYSSFDPNRHWHINRSPETF